MVNLSLTSMSNVPKNGTLVPLACAPLNVELLLDGRSLGSVLAERTGLSPSRLRSGDQRPFRETTIRRAVEKANSWSRERLVALKFTPIEADAFIDQMPSRKFGRTCPFGDHLHRLSGGDSQIFTLTQPLAERIDELCSTLAFARESGNLSAYRFALLNANWLQDLRWWEGSGFSAAHARQKVAEVSDWNAMDSVTKVPFANVWFSFTAAIDLEFTTRYFVSFAPRPLFLDLLPVLGPLAVLGSEIELPARDRFRLPTRRLLELCYSLLHFRAQSVWPSAAPTRQDIAAASGYRDVDIGNFYDGTKKLTGNVFDELWRAMARDFAPLSEQLPPSPTPLLLAALTWQSNFVSFDAKSKIRELTLFEGCEYLTWWHAHRQAWNAELRVGTVEWPVWLDAKPKATTVPAPGLGKGHG